MINKLAKNLAENIEQILKEESFKINSNAKVLLKYNY
jgi:hypothetical protein